MICNLNMYQYAKILTRQLCWHTFSWYICGVYLWRERDSLVKLPDSSLSNFIHLSLKVTLSDLKIVNKQKREEGVTYLSWVS